MIPKTLSPWENRSKKMRTTESASTTLAYPDRSRKTEETEILGGLMAEKMCLPSKYFYNATGSRLFEQITRLHEYYPSRTEKSILKRYARDMMQGGCAALVELGSGDCSKISLLLRTLPAEKLGALTYVPFDVSRSAVERSRQELEANFAPLRINGIVADFMRQIHLVPDYDDRVFCFFGSTLGNLARSEAFRFMETLGRMVQPGERLLVGLDRVKEKPVLETAYNDKYGVTDSFNKNILKVINSIIGADFNPDFFRHHAFFNEEKQRIEMHLVADRDMTVSSPLFERGLKICKGRHIHTENAHKYTDEHIEAFASCGGFRVKDVYSDDKTWFSLVDYVK